MRRKNNVDCNNSGTYRLWRIFTVSKVEEEIVAGTKAGGVAAARSNKLRHGEDFYKRIGAIGGKIGTTGGFAANRELARIAGQKGGRISKRRKKVV